MSAGYYRRLFLKQLFLPFCNTEFWRQLMRATMKMTRMKQRCRDSVWWPGLHRQVENWVHDCEQGAFSRKSVCLLKQLLCNQYNGPHDHGRRHKLTTLVRRRWHVTINNLLLYFLTCILNGLKFKHVGMRLQRQYLNFCNLFLCNGDCHSPLLQIMDLNFPHTCTVLVS